MNNIKNLSLISLCIICLTACGGGSDSSSGTTIATKNALADPDATFKTYQNISFTANNEYGSNITLFVYDNSENLVARHYIKSEESAQVAIQLPAADQLVQISWHYLENVKDEEVGITGLTSITFTGFDG